MKIKYLSILSISAAILFLFTPSTQAGVNDFYFKTFDAKYSLSKDADNRSKLLVTETLVAEFPNINQNHGIERAIPNSYDGHPVNLQIQAVKKLDGSPWEYTTYSSNDNTVIRIGDASTYVRGEQTYIIEYSARDVTKNFESGDEFFWDINGTDWLVPINSAQASLTVDSSIVNSLDGRLKCFSGYAGSTESNCTISKFNDIIITQSTQTLQPNQNISMVVGFYPDTFSSYVAPPVPIWVWIFIFLVVPVFYIIIPIWVIIWGFKKWKLYGRDASKKTTLVPQYLPPKNISMLMSDVIINTKMRPKAVAAAIIDLAVRHYIKIWQVDKKFELELVKLPTQSDGHDAKIIDLLFGSKQQVGERVALDQLTSKYDNVIKISKDTYDEAISDTLMQDTRKLQNRMSLAGILLIIFGIFTFNIILIIASVALLIISYFMPARTAKGVELKTYLDGTKLYMQVAEEERLKLLQGPETAGRYNTSDSSQLIKLYERLLPLAVLYGIEKEWAETLAPIYAQQNQPSWYSNNNNVFNAAIFGSTISNFGTSTITTFSPPSNSSGSGFSGGGSSGGGGGGGGGGGW